MSPEKSRHAAAVDLVQEALRCAFGSGFTVRAQHPLALSDTSEPEPDVAVVVGSPRDYTDEHPASAALVVEVSDTSLAYDRTRKLAVYARCGLPEYWILNLIEARLEVHRNPTGDSYGSSTVLDKDATVTPLGAPGAAVALSDLLP